MRDHAHEAISMLGSRTIEQLRDDRTLQLALAQLIEIVGEAASRVPKNVRDLHSSVSWQLAADMRNRLIHGYDVIDINLVYVTIRDDLPPLVSQIDAILCSSA
jgi:uncharacterized protein with HEPN domain